MGCKAAKSTATLSEIAKLVQTQYDHETPCAISVFPKLFNGDTEFDKEARTGRPRKTTKIEDDRSVKNAHYAEK